MAPPPTGTSFLEETGNKLSFPPRFGEHNESILGKELGITSEELNAMKADGVI